MIYIDQEDYLEAVSFGDTVLERMFNTLGIDDLSISETCYNVAICNKYIVFMVIIINPVTLIKSIKRSLEIDVVFASLTIFLKLLNSFQIKNPKSTI